jgi:hypothetical protein
MQCAQTEDCTMMTQPSTHCIMASKQPDLLPKPDDKRPSASLYSGHR